MRRGEVLLLGTLLLVAACGHEKTARPEKQLDHVSGEIVTVHARQVPAVLDAAGIARPFAEATLSTKLMATVTDVRVREGDLVRAGQVLAVLDARDLEAKNAQISASIGEAQAMQREAETQARRMRALYADDAAAKAQLDAAETGLARANAALASARAGAAELSAVRDYSVIRAPFAGIVTRRYVDPGAFAAPGTPLLTIQDSRRLRVAVTATSTAVNGLVRGDSLPVRIENAASHGVVEGVVPAAGSVYTVNIIVDNTRQQFLAGAAASVTLPLGMRAATMVPATAVRREGDLTGVLVRNSTGDELRWVRLGRDQGTDVEVVAGIREGEQVIVPVSSQGAR